MTRSDPARNDGDDARDDALVVLLTSPASYRAAAFRIAAARIGLRAVEAVDLPESLADRLPSSALALDFLDPDGATDRLVSWARRHGPVAAVLAVDDRGGEVAVRASERLGLAHNTRESALAARDKAVMRAALEHGGVPVPRWSTVRADTDPATIAREQIYPVVVKPTLLSGSRGVIRADDAEAFVAAFRRTRGVLERAGMPPEHHPILIERYVPGVEVALEGLLTDGALTVLALFDKPDPLEGPFFEETIYVTPSRLPAPVQAAVAARTEASARAVGLRSGPVHAELRIDLARTEPDIWMIELAGRSIGGLCASVLEFGTGMPLEELILRHAAGLAIASTQRAGVAAGVMMIPIPRGGILRETCGLEAARAVAGVTGIEITAPVNQPIVPLPEGESYLGFIFARGDTPEAVEATLREAHGCLTFRIDPALTLTAR